MHSLVMDITMGGLRETITLGPRRRDGVFGGFFPDLPLKINVHEPAKATKIPRLGIFCNVGGGLLLLSRLLRTTINIQSIYSKYFQTSFHSNIRTRSKEMTVKLLIFCQEGWPFRRSQSAAEVVTTFSFSDGFSPSVHKCCISFLPHNAGK